MRILLVDDDPVCLVQLEAVSRALGYDVVTAANGREAFDIIRRGDVRIVVSDWQMPEMSGVELCRRVRERSLSAYVYFILLTSLDRSQNLVGGLSAGADDFLSKPFNPNELQVRLRAAERIVSLETRDLLIFALAKLAESRDPDTGAHLERIREYCRVLTEELAGREAFRDQIDPDYVRTIYLTSPLHDIGKVGIPDHVLLKPGRLTPEEFEIMKQHAWLGAQTLDAALRVNPTAEFLRFARDIAWCHHEKYNGTGYPRGLAGEEIPLCGRIVAVADVYDALTTKRVYKPAFSHQQAYDLIVAGRGQEFDPEVVDAFIDREHEFQSIRQRLTDEAGGVQTPEPGTWNSAAVSMPQAVPAAVESPPAPIA